MNKIVEDEPKSSKFSFITEYFDLRGFAVSVVVAVSYAAAVMLPTLIAQPNFWNFWRLAAGHFSFDGNFVDVPGYGVPQTLPVLAIVAGMPDLAQQLESILISSGPLIFGVVVLAGVMVLLDKTNGEEHKFMRRILFLTMILMLWVNLTGPRGVYKYYFSLFGPFFSIFASGRMIRGSDEHVPVSLSMFLMPFAFTLMILIPERTTYLLYVVIIFALYLLAPLFDRLYDLVKRPFRLIKKFASRRVLVEIEPLEVRYDSSISRRLRVLEHIIIISSALMGAMLFLYGAYICYPRITGAISLILQYFMVAGVLIVIGVQMLSIAVNGLLPQEERRTDLNYVFKTLSYTLATVVLIFGIVTYSLSWNIDLFIERQALVLSSTLMIFWALSLVVKLKKHIRLFGGLLLLFGASFATWTWSTLGDAVMYNLGLACIAGLILYIMFVMVEFLDSDKTVDEDVSKPMEIETLVQ